MVVTRSQKKKKLEEEKHTDGRNNFGEIPLDEIIGRLPAKSVARFLLISKLWARIIRSRDFITSFPFGSCSSQPLLLVAFIDIDRKRQCQDWYLFSQSSYSSSSTTSSLPCVTCPLPIPEREYHSQYVNGLISLCYGQVQFITNPSTGKSILLPSVNIEETVYEQSMRSFFEQLMRSFFGYDSVNDQYKVLCMWPNQRRQESTPLQHQVVYVHTLGAKTKKSWRVIKCGIPHFPSSNAHVCIDGVVYYVAKTSADFLQPPSLMRFDLKSEKLDLFTSFSEDMMNVVYQLDPMMNLINYEGKVAIPTKTSPYTFEVWVMDQYAENHAWLKKSFSIEPWKSLFHRLEYLHIRGTTHGKGEFILAPRIYTDDFSVVYYNPDDTNSFKIIKVEVTEDYEFKRRGARAIVFSDYVESVRLL